METGAAPNHVDLVYRKVGKTHVLASKGISGLVHVAHPELKEAVRCAMSALSAHISRVYNVDVCYVLDNEDSLNNDRQCSDVGVIGARIDHACAPM